MSSVVFTDGRDGFELDDEVFVDEKIKLVKPDDLVAVLDFEFHLTAERNAEMP